MKPTPPELAKISEIRVEVLADGHSGEASPQQRPTTVSDIDEDLLRLSFAAMGKTFRGEIYEDDADNEHIAEFVGCHFHRKIFRDAQLSSTRRIGLRAANQIGKSRIGELIMKHRMKHDPGNMVMYDITDDKVIDHMKNRFMPLLKSIPQLGAVIRELLDNPDTRFNVTTADILFPGMIFRARPLNEQWTQSITVRYGQISDAALAGKNGQIRRAFVRSRQHEADELWFIESQGGVEGDDFTSFMATTNEMKLQVRCPLCGGKQRFLWHHERKEDFKATLPRKTVEEILRKYGCEGQTDDYMKEQSAK